MSSNIMCIKSKISSFLNSIYFIIFINIISIIFWYLEQPMYAYIIYLISFIFIILTDANRIVTITLIMNGLIGYRIVSTPEYNELYRNNLLVFLPIALIALSVAFYDFFYKRKEKFKYKNEIIYGLIGIVLANVLSLINADHNTIWLICLGILETISFLIIFLYFYNVKDENSIDYLSKTSLLLGLSITVQIIIHILTKSNDYDFFYFPLGWGNRNTISIMYMAIIPLTFYLYFKNQKNRYALFLVCVYLVMTLMMISRGAYLTLALLSLPFFIITYQRIDDKKKYLKDISLSMGIILVLVIVIIFSFSIEDVFYEHVINKILVGIFDLTGREEIYPIGYELFLRYPLFGAGSYTGAYFLRTLNDMGVGTYHNYLIHIVATTGLVGLVIFLYYLVAIFKKVLIDDKFNLCVLIIIFNFLIHGLFDNTFFNPLFMIFLSLVLPLLNEEGMMINILFDNSKKQEA